MKGSILTAAVAGLFLASLANGASAQMGGGVTRQSAPTSMESSKTCTVKSVASSSFDCGSQTYQVTSSTTYMGTSFGQLAAGMKVTVQYHTAPDGSAVADGVTAS